MKIVVTPENAGELQVAANLARVLRIAAPVLANSTVTPDGRINITVTDLYKPITVELARPPASAPKHGFRELILDRDDE